MQRLKQYLHNEFQRLYNYNADFKITKTVTLKQRENLNLIYIYKTNPLKYVLKLFVMYCVIDKVIIR